MAGWEMSLARAWAMQLAQPKVEVSTEQALALTREVEWDLQPCRLGSKLALAWDPLVLGWD